MVLQKLLYQILQEACRIHFAYAQSFEGSQVVSMQLRDPLSSSHLGPLQHAAPSVPEMPVLYSMYASAGM